jgi:uncharacterized membrane protein YkvA (DUF1232 family)
MRKSVFNGRVRSQPKQQMFARSETVHFPSTLEEHARIVEREFWPRLLKVAGRVPFAEDLAAAWFCVIDPATPGRVRGVVLAALVWFILAASVLPEFLPLAGFTQ